MNDFSLIGRKHALFEHDVSYLEPEISSLVSGAKFLVVGGAGTIGQAVTREIFKRDPKVLHVVDISENNMVELVRDIRSTIGYGTGDFRTFSIDCGSKEFEALLQHYGAYDYVFNLSALKHVRSEKDPFTLMRMLNVNVLNTIKVSRLIEAGAAKKYFCVSTDKATNPVNMMGASKRIMEMYMMRESLSQCNSMARFANVAFSDGSLLHGFNNRILKSQPLSAPIDIRRYFVTPQESGELCLISGLFGENRDILFPKLSEKLNLISFSDIAKSFLLKRGYTPYECQSEAEARSRSDELIGKKQWPCYFFKSDTTGEKDFEEFYSENDYLDLTRFKDLGIIQNEADFNENKLDDFTNGITNLANSGIWDKNAILELYHILLPDFNHKETGKYLDQRM